MKAQANDVQFQEDIQKLNLLSGNKDNLEAFIEVYRQALETVYNAMMQCRNVDKLLAGEYRARGELLKTMLQSQLAQVGLSWPGEGKQNE
jgi:hypothetical protein